MKKVIFAALAMAAFATANAQDNVQHATLTTHIPVMIALRPYDGISMNDNQTLHTDITMSGVFANNNFSYQGNGGTNMLEYKIYSNTTYQVSLGAQNTGSNDELNGYVSFWATTLPSPQNGVAPYVHNGVGNVDHTILVPSTSPSTLNVATTSPVTILSNSGASTGAYPAPSTNPTATDFAAFGIGFACSPGFAIFPGDYTTNLVVTATPL